MANFWEYNPKTKFSQMYNPTQQGEGTNTGGPTKGAGGRAINQFNNYDDYLAAYSADPSQYSASGGGGIQNPMSSGAWNAFFDSRNLVELMKPSWKPFSEAQFDQAQVGRNIASGKGLEDASARAQQMLQDTMGGGPTGADAQMYDYYKQLLQDPNSGMNTPQQAWLRQQGEETVRRTSPRLSGRRAIAAQEYGQGLASQEYGKTLAQRLSASGEEKSRWQAGQEGRNQSASLRAQLAMQPAMAKFNQYWQSEGA